MRFLAAVVQLTTTLDVEHSLAQAEVFIEAAVARGARLVVLPENTSFMGSEAAKLKLAEPLDGSGFARLGAAAKRHGIWLVAGTLPESAPSASHAYNTSVLFGPSGSPLARYRKIHLFDVELGEGATHKESSSVAPGDAPCLVATELATIGLSVCYDLRFPDLYRTLARHGAELLTVPAAFTVPTGRDHWEVLLRARAIENQCYVLAAGQFGAHDETRRTYGRSMIIDPWGTVLATVPDGIGFTIAEIDLDALRSLRRRLPCLSHDRPEVSRKVPSTGL